LPFQRSMLWWSSDSFVITNTHSNYHLYVKDNLGCYWSALKRQRERKKGGVVGRQTQDLWLKLRPLCHWNSILRQPMALRLAPGGTTFCSFLCAVLKVSNSNGLNCVFQVGTITICLLIKGESLPSDSPRPLGFQFLILHNPTHGN